ncbi:Uncharacterised protein [Vibrio cholerae]|nr:Uncharacterised protein [Vibrio cholerae]CSI83098.1 Uncharacterised protein [Vibrio cholerae]
MFQRQLYRPFHKGSSPTLLYASANSDNFFHLVMKVAADTNLGSCLSLT